MSKKNTGKVVTMADSWTGPWQPFLDGYKVYPELTAKLDSPELRFTQKTINEIALWKIGRYIEIPTNLLAKVESLRELTPGEHRRGESVLASLLNCNGVRLPMASTILRFAKPDVFQIIDRHIWRAVYGHAFPKLSKKPAECCPVYFKFLDDLRVLCERIGIDFPNSDRILFEFDKKQNPPLKESEQTS